ncbi:MAG: glycoside hydrolase family 3 C-terminal domain-containing protein [Chloroflexota bacterium]|nr:glycoside hydrolase family 3 C-terminal domain-containing protein [Chloroflexota bacterium]
MMHKYLNPEYPFAERVDDLVGRLTLEEKIGQMMHKAPAIEWLGIPAYNWWNECLHGVARAGVATVFPQAIGMAASWNLDLIHEVGTAISDEARAKYHEAQREGNYEQYYGLTFWTPNLNIFRDPRWGRGQETYGEDPFLTARMGVVFISALQGNDPRYLKTAACAKHYAVHSGPEADRHHFDAVTSLHDLWETYLPAFEAAVREANVESVMGAYNRTNGEACCASQTLLGHILRKAWSFTGHVVSDCGAIDDIYLAHKLASTAEAAAALAVNQGCDLNCGCTYEALTTAVSQGLIDEETIERSVKRLFMTRMKLGMFDPPEQVPYAAIPFSVNDCSEHRALARQAACESLVLLKNDGILPLDKAALKRIAIIGPNADDAAVLFGNYNGYPSESVTPLEGIRRAVGEGVEVVYAKGCHIWKEDTSGYGEAIELAKATDVVLFFGGLNQGLEGEEGQEEGLPPGEKSQGDRTSIELPIAQEALLQALHATGKPIILVLMNGSAIAINWADAHLPAILEAWYPGEEGGNAIADALFGDYNPAGRLPVTFYRATSDLPAFTDYSMANRTYRYFGGDVLYPFGYGLSYTTFAYNDFQTEWEHDLLHVRVTVTNTGKRAGNEVVQLYIRHIDASVRAPSQTLQGFQRIHLVAGESKVITFTLTLIQFMQVNDAGVRRLELGNFEISVGGGQPGKTASGVKAVVAVT